jgi:hypothetical protein
VITALWEGRGGDPSRRPNRTNPVQTRYTDSRCREYVRRNDDGNITSDVRIKVLILLSSSGGACVGGRSLEMWLWDEDVQRRVKNKVMLWEEKGPRKASLREGG